MIIIDLNETVRLKYANHSFVFRNLSFDTEEEDLEDKFEEYGELAFCKIVVDPNTERSKGNAIYEVSNQCQGKNC